MASVTLANVKKAYGDSLVVRGVELSVADGEFLVLLGPSGSGKSTVLRMIAGLETVTEGDIHIDARVVTFVNPGDRDVAMVFQSYALYPHLTVYKNLSYGLHRRRVPKVDIARQVSEVTALLGIDHLLDRLPGQLSGGQRQRVALGRAIVRKPAVFLMDEPLSNLDAKLRVQMRRELMSLHQRLGVTTIYVTHDQVEAMTMGDRIVVMHDGLIQQVGTPLELYTRPANTFVASFLGSPQMNEVPGRLTFGGRGVLFDAEGISLILDAHLPDNQSRDVLMGVRPQSLWATHDAEKRGFVHFARGIVEGVEHHGSESFASIRLGERAVVAVIEPGLPCPLGSERDIALAPDALLFFDPDDGTRLDLFRERELPAMPDPFTAQRSLGDGL